MAITTITNVSTQSIPVIVNSILPANADTASDISASTDKTIYLVAGAELNIESSRIDLAQLDQLRNKNLIIYTSR